MMTCEVRVDDCRQVLPTLEAESLDAAVTDPPYEIGFMGKAWDGTGVAFDPATWEAVRRVLKPGAFLAAFGGTRTHHRLMVAIEDAGFELVDTLMWVYGSGMPKVGYIRDRDGQHVVPGFGGSLKPAWEPIVLARKPFRGSLRANLASRGTGGLNIDANRVATGDDTGRTRTTALGVMNDDAWQPQAQESESHPLGRWPANVVHDGSDEVLAGFPQTGKSTGGIGTCTRGTVYGNRENKRINPSDGGYGDSGSAARFFYCTKASKADRGAGNTHPTVKPTALMRWVCRLVTPPGGLIVDPFMGSGSTGTAALLEGFGFVGITDEEHHAQIARRRLAEVSGFALAS